MGKQWLRMVDSAQRKIQIDDPQSPSWPQALRLTVEIQGLWVEQEDRKTLLSFTEMYELGVHLNRTKPLSLWDRLRRRPGYIADVQHQKESKVLLNFWTQPHMDLVFDMADDTDAALWREVEIMAMSAGFHYAYPPELAAQIPNEDEA